MNRPEHDDAIDARDASQERSAIEAERTRRLRAVWEQAEPSAFEVAAAETRLAAERRARASRGRSVRLLAIPAIAAALLAVVFVARRAAPPIMPVSESAPLPAIAAPAGPTASGSPRIAPSPLTPEAAAANDLRRLTEAEALHRAGQCRLAKPVLEELAAQGATPEVRARAGALLEEIARLPAPR